MSDKYNGWTNRETWAAHLWLANDQSTHEFWADEIEGLKRASWTANLKGHPCMASWVRGTLATRLKEEFANITQDAMQRDGVLTARAFQVLHDIGSLWRVNWDEIAAALAV